jgi:hypothetical protein
MESLITGSTWLSMTAAGVVGPLMALLIGFVGTDRLLQWQLSERTQVGPVEADDEQGGLPRRV